MPSPEIVFDTLFAYQRSAALKAAIDLEVFTAIDEGAQTAAGIAKKSGSAERGIRILCDYLTIIGLLTKPDGAYQLTPDTAAFLSKNSPMYFGTVAQFLTLPEMKKNFDGLTETVRRGGVAPTGNTVADENPIWVEFARSMVPMMLPAGHAIAGMVADPAAGAIKVLDIAAGHGMFGVIIAQHNPKAEVVAVDWAPVLKVAEENARAAGVESRYKTAPGDAFKVDFGTGYDVVLVPNFLHHFDHATCTTFLKKCHAALKTGGRVVVVEFVPNADRVSPPMAAGFSLTMLAGTPAGDAYTMAELEKQLRDAGFNNISAHALPTPETILLAQK
ncbi:MAG TPA: class I SAM-dependent methyltransferase [Vicinamibacterales bacterium]|jgi:ubiquinone/menaquinone biosynthesis C-methylase UbiE|nr:class I SAM-dependent methyltransferase [Vicinamibacterales bacterium]